MTTTEVPPGCAGLSSCFPADGEESCCSCGLLWKGWLGGSSQLTTHSSRIHRELPAFPLRNRHLIYVCPQVQTDSLIPKVGLGTVRGRFSPLYLGKASVLGADEMDGTAPWS